MDKIRLPEKIAIFQNADDGKEPVGGGALKEELCEFGSLIRLTISYPLRTCLRRGESLSPENEAGEMCRNSPCASWIIFSHFIATLPIIPIPPAAITPSTPPPPNRGTSKRGWCGPASRPIALWLFL